MAFEPQDHERKEVFRRWIQARIEAIHRQVTAYDVLRRNGVSLRNGGAREEQFACPFHGRDNKPSVRYHPESNRGPSHAWCFVCQERWDCIALYKKFEGFEGKFTQLLAMIERDNGLTAPEGPPPEAHGEDEEALAQDAEVHSLLGICERRLLAAKELFDMKAYLVLGTILDRLYGSLDDRRVLPLKAKETIRLVLDKIGQRERACPDV